MEQILVKQSIGLKCKIGTSRMLGNYEFFYAAGVFCHLAGADPAAECKPEELQQFLKPLLGSYQPKDKKEEILLKMLREYELNADYDENMPQLLRQGLEDGQKYL